ncbi:hypothetical protein FXW30_04235 [Candidatus Liberibacter asiaticus]|nr:hypothetical protein FXW22_04185 [Candidatus Liberibacter asiaticus]KAE9511362.1 hypothetical protein FXW31_01800 [Candidatus Liberibacter asiaticus]KAE9511954.1 hypothetical protein FXW32_04255 [Candidatus Liberibacter asiaticus]KAE9513035.1 hypothetical protein FXW35_04300 [Candidatus Liberibacter asiaticus]KAE9514113.1 hypothetical protein FXW25_04215 [Candidatus Liberibacter asiaticus]
MNAKRLIITSLISSTLLISGCGCSDIVPLDQAPKGKELVNHMPNK